MAVKLTASLRELLGTMNLGRNERHPLAGWQLLTILYHDATSTDVPLTVNALADRYNADYLDRVHAEAVVSDKQIKDILMTLQRGRLVEENTRRVRQLMSNGNYMNHQSSVYRITAGGIEFMNAMQRVIDAEVTVSANTERIHEYTQLLRSFQQAKRDASTTKLFNDFIRFTAAYDEVMKGMHRLEEDLAELADSIVFNHGSQAAAHLQSMLQNQAMPVFQMLLDQEPRLRSLAHDQDFMDDVALSQQGSDSLDVSKAQADQTGLTLQAEDTRGYVHDKLATIALSMSYSTTAIDTSLDSMYLIFSSIKEANDILSQEYAHVTSQTIDVTALTKRLDELLLHYQTLQVALTLPRHQAADREIADPLDLLDATTLGPVSYAVQQSPQPAATQADNPEVAADDPETENSHLQALREFQKLVMQENSVVVDHDLEFTTKEARDEVMRLGAALDYDHLTSFAPFGRPVAAIKKLETGPISLHCAGETYHAWLPQGYKAALKEL